MSVRIISHDARKSFLDKIEALNQGLSNLRIVKSRAWIVPPDIEQSKKLFTEVRDLYLNVLRSPDWVKSESYPIPFNFDDQGVGIFNRKIHGIILLYQNLFYCVSGPYNPEEASAIVLKKYQKQKSTAEFLLFRKDAPESEGSYKREKISSEVQNEVWRRDRGQCSICGSVRNLEFDHIVPVSKGGSNTTRNVQLLCETCNRSKSNTIG